MVYNNTNDTKLCNDCLSKTLLIPILSQFSNKTWVQAFIYLFLMLSLFMGIAIIADIFMCSIEKITSATKKIYKRSKDGKELEVIEVPIWNKTVANLSLMALGSSAPEILLATIEVIGNGFTAGDLGPGAIVGASAFNLFVITAVCVISIPKNESKRISAIKVFAVSAFFNTFAYIWLYLVLTVFTPGYVNVTEAVLTFLFFPLLVIIGYAADQNFFRKNNWSQFGDKIFSNGEVNEKNLTKFIKEVRKIDNYLTIEECEKLAKVYIFNNQKHSSLFYRISAIRSLSAANSPIPQLNERLQKIYHEFEENLSNPMRRESIEQSNHSNVKLEMQNRTKQSQKRDQNMNEAVVSFTSEAITVMESDPEVEIIVERSAKLDNSFVCEIETIDRTAIADCDYKAVKQSIKFGPQETEKRISIKIISDNEWSPDRVFLVKLNLSNNQMNNKVVKGDISIMQVTIVDDDEPGIIEFVQRMIVVADSQHTVIVPLIRCQGSDGEVRVRWRTIDGSAKNGYHFYGGEGEIIFGDGIIKKDIEIPIINHLEEEREEYFELILIEATAGALIGKINRVMVTITDDQNYDNTMKKIMPKLNKNTFELHREEWVDQIKAAFTLGDNESNGYNELSTLEYVSHFLSFGWKVLFSLLPPTKLYGGWLTFFSSLVVIGILTAFMGDFASAFGCLVGLEDHVTALTFVALGTSLPDLFASRVAAIREQYADNAIGNVTGSNAFNVFLGLGLPWLVATIYHSSNNTRFDVPSDSLQNSVSLFVILSIFTIIILVIRRNLSIFGFGELGGPKKYARITFFVFISFWIIYIGLSVWWSYST